MDNIYRSFDSRLEHRALGSAAVTSTATVATIAERVAQRTRYVTKVIVEAIKISANDERYTFVVECSNDDFSTFETAAVRDFGATEVRTGGAPDSAAGQSFDIYWATEMNGVRYAKSRIRCIIAGTSPTITFGCWSGVEGGV